MMNREKRSCLTPKQDARRKLLTVFPLMCSGMLVSAFVVSILSGAITWVTQFGTLSLFAGKIAAMNRAFMEPGLHWTPYTGKLGPRIGLALSAIPYFQNMHGRSSLIIPLTWIFILSLSVSVALNRRLFRRHRPGVCFCCGYDIRGVKTCPECGMIAATFFGTNRAAWAGPLGKACLFLVVCAIAPILIVTMFSSIAYDATNLTIYLSQFSVGLIWPDDGFISWDNEGLRMDKLASCSIAERLGIFWPTVYLNQAEMTRIVRLPVWFCGLFTGVVVWIARAVRRKRHKKQN